MLADPRVDVNCKGLDSIPPLTLPTRDIGFVDTFQLLLADERVEVNSVALFNRAREEITLEATPLLAATWSNILRELAEHPKVDLAVCDLRPADLKR